jgi:arginyl-tRNA synthetase
MSDLKTLLKLALEKIVPPETEVVIQDTPADKPGDYGSPVAFLLAKALKQNPVQIAKELAAKVELPVGVTRAEAVGPYLNFFVDQSAFVQSVISSIYTPTSQNQKVIIEHTSVNPNKEWHVGHIRGALIGDALGRIYRAAGYNVEIQNYIDDTGRQAAESQFAVKHYNAIWDGAQKYDHWLGELYVRLHKDYDFKKKTPEALALEPAIADVIHALERGELRNEIETVVKAQLETAYSLGIEYDLLTWESDVVHAGLVERALGIFADRLEQPTEGKYAGAKGIDLSPFVPNLEEPFKVLVRGNGTYVYETKDIAYHYWKFGLFEGLEFKNFAKQPSSKTLYTTAPKGELHPDNQTFAHANQVINVIDSRQGLAQIVVKAGLSLISDGTYAKYHHHLANETVLLEGETMSGRKGITVSADEVIAEAKARAKKVLAERLSPSEIIREAQRNAGMNVTYGDEEWKDRIGNSVGLGALKFAFLKVEPNRQIDFRWENALALQGDTAPVIQYAHARARTLLRNVLYQQWMTTDMNGVKLPEALEVIQKKWAELADFSSLGELELNVLKTVARYPEVLALCTRDKSAHPMCAYALELAAAFNSYYNHKGADGKSDTSVLHAPEGLREARLAVVTRVADAIKKALEVLGIDAPDEM